MCGTSLLTSSHCCASNFPCAIADESAAEGEPGVAAHPQCPYHFADSSKLILPLPTIHCKFCITLHRSVQVNPNAILVSQRQKGNPMLQHIRNVRYQFADIIPDYQMGQQTCALFLSLR